MSFQGCCAIWSKQESFNISSVIEHHYLETLSLLNV